MDLQRDILIAHGSVSDVDPAQVAEIRLRSVFVGAELVDQSFGAVQQAGLQSIRPALDAAPDLLHVTAFQLVKFCINVRQR